MNWSMVSAVSPLCDTSTNAGSLQDGGHALHDLAVERGREEQRLARGGRGGHDLLHGGPEAHVEHAVGLVEHEHLHVAQLHVAALHEVVEAPGRGHEDVDAAVELRELALVRHAAHHGDHAAGPSAFASCVQAASICWASSRVGLTTSARGDPGLLGAADALDDGQRERGRLAGAGGRRRPRRRGLRGRAGWPAPARGWGR